jgi:large subunit ribosomal protein L22
VIKEAVIGEAPTIKRVRPKARGSAGPVRKRNSHIRIVLTDEVPIIRRSDKPKSSGKGKAKSKKPEVAAPVTEAPAEQSA